MNAEGMNWLSREFHEFRNEMIGRVTALEVAAKSASPVKPEKKPDVVKYIGFDECRTLRTYLIVDDNTDKRWRYAVSLTFSGETGELIKAEVLK